MNVLRDQDQGFVLARIPSDIRALLKGHRLILGGGFIRDTIAGFPVSDIDLFGPDSATLEAAALLLAVQRDGRKIDTPNAITLLAPPRMPVQFITRWMYSEPEAVVSSFDFTVCQAALWYDLRAHQWQSRIGDDFYPDLAARRLVYTSPQRDEAAGGSLMRVRKFLARGYNIQAASLAAVVARLVLGAREGNQNPEFDTRTEHGLAHVLTGLLHEVDPIRVMDGRELVDEHQLDPQGGGT